MLLKLRDCRLNSGISQESLADLLGMTQCNYSRRENGKKKISISEWEKIAKILNVKVEDIFHSVEKTIDEDISYSPTYVKTLEKEIAHLKRKINTLQNNRKSRNNQ